MRKCLTKFSRILECFGAKVCTSCRSCQELSNEYLLAKFGVDTAENAPLSKSDSSRVELDPR